MKSIRGTFREKPGFCQGADSVIKISNSKVFALDASQMMLHVFDLNLAIWSSNSLAAHKVPI